MNVILADIDTHVLDITVRVLKDQKLSVEGIALDVSLKSEWVEALKKANEMFGNVHLLFNNAGVGPTGSQKNISENDWRWQSMSI